MRILKIIAGIVGVAMLIAIASGYAAAHGDAAWIQANPDYRDRNGAHCCGVNDCGPVEQGEIRRIPGGWLHVPTMTTIMDDERGVYASERAVPSRCVRGGIKCYFPATGA